MNKEKIISLLNIIFGLGIYLTVFAGGLTFLGFIGAILIGGATGELIAVSIQKYIFPIIIKFSSLSIGIGMLSMYISNEQALSLASDKEEAENELNKIMKN